MHIYPGKQTEASAKKRSYPEVPLGIHHRSVAAFLVMLGVFIEAVLIGVYLA